MFRLPRLSPVESRFPVIPLTDTSTDTLTGTLCAGGDAALRFCGGKVIVRRSVRRPRV